MKNVRNRIAKIATVIFVATFLSNNVFAMNFSNNVKTEIPQKMVQNLVVGIASDNLGLKTTCIYYAGFYEIESLVKPLIEQLAKETNPNTRVLIALALYKIGSTEAINAVEKLAENDVDPAVKKISVAILSGFQNNQSYSSNLNFSNK